MFRTLAILALLSAALASAAIAQTRPASQPAEERRNPRAVERTVDAMERYVAGVAGLTAEQRTKIAAFIAEGRAELEALATPRAARREGRDEMLEALERMRDRVRAILPAGSRAALPFPPGRFERAANREEAATKPALATSRPSVVPEVGVPFSPFRMTRVDGKLATNESLMGRPAVVVFASWSSPATRDQLPRIADLAARYGSRASWLIVYTREMFPAGDAASPERNREEKIDAPAATSDAERMTAAKRLVEAMKLKLDVAPDAIDDRLTRGANGFPNAAFVLDAQGRIVARLGWAEPFAIKRQLDQLLATPARQQSIR